MYNSNKFGFEQIPPKRYLNFFCWYFLVNFIKMRWRFSRIPNILCCMHDPAMPKYNLLQCSCKVGDAFCYFLSFFVRKHSQVTSKEQEGLISLCARMLLELKRSCERACMSFLEVDWLMEISKVRYRPCIFRVVKRLMVIPLTKRGCAVHGAFLSTMLTWPDIISDRRTDQLTDRLPTHSPTDLPIHQLT